MGRDKQSPYGRDKCRHLVYAFVQSRYQKIRSFVDYLLVSIDSQLIPEHLLVVRHLRQIVVQEPLQGVQALLRIGECQTVRLLPGGYLRTAEDIRLTVSDHSAYLPGLDRSIMVGDTYYIIAFSQGRLHYERGHHPDIPTGRQEGMRVKISPEPVHRLRG